MPRFQFVLSTTDGTGEAGVVTSDSFTHALAAVGEHASPKNGDVLEIGVAGFPPARYTCVRTAAGGAPNWLPAHRLAA